ncbi:hypothetical protein CE91St54_08450 [Hungatella hathewayi]|uniref:Uncharacterized protein n=1 Tax=Hungatella hathewayi TaxID=154046 RepID=A0AA37N2B8_9FIRM|nr:hypothetical protein CE91St55_08960 [Hungatella hathewayi]GKH05737.1 hypothetical protein CE91St54_08450 [Hungatella hathewayi]
MSPDSGVMRKKIKTSLPKDREVYRSFVKTILVHSSAGVYTLCLAAPAVFGSQYFAYCNMIYD